MTDFDCDAFHDAMAELALGVLDGRERAAALGHVAVCPACRRELARMCEVADRLVELTPGAEPPAGFESRVLAVLRQGDDPDAPVPLVASGAQQGGARRPAAHHRRSRRARRGPVALAAAAVVAVALAVGGWAIGQETGGGPRVGGHAVVTADLRSGRSDLGEVIATTGPEPWMAMAVDTGLGSTAVECQAEGANGAPVDLGWFTLTNGSGYWSAPVARAALPLRAVRILDYEGRTVATATFPA